MSSAQVSDANTIGVAEAAHRERTPAARIARGEQRVAHRDDQAVRALDAVQRVGEPLGRRRRRSTARAGGRSTSESFVDAKIEPCSSSSRRSSPALIRLPLCASVMYPPFDRATTGCAFSIVDEPDVL